MEQYAIKGGNPLVGEVEIGGAKNAALAILCHLPFWHCSHSAVQVREFIPSLTGFRPIKT